MSVYDGKGKGAKRRRADVRYYRAVGRQLLMHDRQQLVRRGDALVLPAPVGQFLRAEHIKDGKPVAWIDFRSWAREAGQ